MYYNDVHRIYLQKGDYYVSQIHKSFAHTGCYRCICRRLLCLLEQKDLDNDLEPVSHREYVSLNRSEASSDAKDSSDSEESSTDKSPATSEGTIANETSSKPEKSSDSEVDASSDSEDMTE